jgi:glucosamine--fructose-6-phosphate aminotransferase (isomerizing)
VASAFELEAAEIPALLARQAASLPALLAPIVTRLEQMAPPLVVTIARGSSEHAAQYAAYELARRSGIPTVPLQLSLASVYGAPLRLDGALALAVSQSGASPDLALGLQAARAAGAFCMGLVNDTDTPLDTQVDVRISLDAGPERAIAATKTFVTSAAALLQLVAGWSHDDALRCALAALPDALQQVPENTDADAITSTLAGAHHVFVVARGGALPIARELALKLGEVAGIHAEAHSAAGLMHGPLARVSAATPVILFEGDILTAPSLLDAQLRVQGAGAPLIALGASGVPGAFARIATPTAGHDALQPLADLYTIYPLLARLARRRGVDPDRTPHLEKATRTR